MSIFLEALTYLGIATAAALVGGLLAAGIVIFDDWTDRMAQRAAKRRNP